MTKLRVQVVSPYQLALINEGDSPCEDLVLERRVNGGSYEFVDGAPRWLAPEDPCAFYSGSGLSAPATDEEYRGRYLDTATDRFHTIEFRFSRDRRIVGFREAEVASAE